MTPELSVIVPTLNRAELLRSMLTCLLGQTLPGSKFEIIVVDDSDGVDTARVIETLAAPNLIYQRGDHGGLAAARNQAIECARGRVLVFMDDDAFVRPDYLEQHLRMHVDHTDYVVTGPIVVIHAIPRSPLPKRGWAGYHRNPFPGGNASLAREHVVAAGRFDEVFSQYGWDDLEFAERLLRQGLRRRFVWGAAIFHYKPPGLSRDVCARLRIERQRGAMGALFYRKYPCLRVGVMTKMWGPIRWLDRLVAGLLPLDKMIERIECAEGTIRPLSLPLQTLLLNHAEIQAGRQQMDRLRNRIGPPGVE